MTKSRLLLAALLSSTLVFARQDPIVCGSTGYRGFEQYHRHLAAAKSAKLKAASVAPALQPDAGNIAVLSDGNGVIIRRNPFNLNQRTLRFSPSQPAATSYHFALDASSYDETAASAGTPLTGIGDDDTRFQNLPFAFPFYGTSYTGIWVNSDGNLTFTAGDSASTDRSLGHFNAGPPRIAPLFADLDPTSSPGAIRVLSESGRFIISWDRITEFRDGGGGNPQTFQARLYPDGRIEFAYQAVPLTAAVVGITPGNFTPNPALVTFLSTQSQDYASAIVEQFAATPDVDIFTAAQLFYQNHEDAYDYVAIYNTVGIQPIGGEAVAFEVTVRNIDRSGYGDVQGDFGAETGSRKRLQSILNMGPLAQYPTDPNGVVPARGTSKDTPLTVLGHESGHLFLAYASVRDPNDPAARPMLGRSLAHWNFAFNSEASLLEGNRIRDNGPTASPRFTTTATVEGYAPLDQYLMGFRAPADVPATFLVNNPSAATTDRAPQSGVSFNGTRRDISIDEVIQAEGPRIPDSTVAQRRFRMAFILITSGGAAPTAAQVAQLDAYRTQFESAYDRFSSSNGVMETSLLHAVTVSTFPASGVLQGGTAPVTLSIEKPAASPLSFALSTQKGFANVPSIATIPTGATQVTANLSGAEAGVDQLLVSPSSTSYESVISRIQVLDPASLQLKETGGDKQTAHTGQALAPIEFRATDQNLLPYAGLTVKPVLTGGGTVSPAAGVTDETGRVRFTWTPGPGPAYALRASLDSGTSATATAIGRPAFASASVVNAASFAPGIVAGGIATLFGTSLSTGDLATLQLTVNGQAAQVFYGDTQQINFAVPASVTGPTATIAVQTTAGASDAITVPVLAIQPGIFYDPTTTYGAILKNGSAQATQFDAPAAGDYIQIYATGLGPLQTAQDGIQQTTQTPTIQIGTQPIQPQYSGPAPGFPGLYQINVQIPTSTPSGTQDLSVTIGGVQSNVVKIKIR